MIYDFLSCMFVLCFFLPFIASSSTSNETNIFPDPENCQNYYLCFPPEACTLETCDPVLLFDDVLLACNFAEFVDCGDRPNPISTTPKPTEITTEFLEIYPDPENCQNYYLCDFPGECTLEFCDDVLLFDDVLMACNFAEFVDCGDRPNPLDPDYSTSTKSNPTISNEFTSTTKRSPATTITSYITTATTTTFTTTTTKTTTTTTTLTTTTTKTTTTTISLDTTTTSNNDDRYPKRVLGMYLAIADDEVMGYHTDDAWAPKLYEYQQQGSNVLFFTFINPESMKVPISFKNLASTKGSELAGSVPASTKIIFSIGGYSYSQDPNPWEWLTTKEKAESMAEVVATWKDLYGCDGIDLDIEEGAGQQEEAGRNMAHFVRRLRDLQPNLIINQPTYGYPQIPAQIDVINESYNLDRSSNNLVDSVGIMTYEGTESLLYIKNFADASNQWPGFPITCNTPYNVVLVGCKGTNNATDIETLANESLNQDLLGVMVWYASVIDGFQYAKDWDASFDDDSKSAFVSAMEILSNG